MLVGINNKLQIIGFSKWRFEEALRWDCLRESWELSEEESTKVLRRGSSGASCTNLCTVVIMRCRVSGSEKLWSSHESMQHHFFFTSPLLQGNNRRFCFQGLPMFVYCIVICRFYDLIYIAADNQAIEEWEEGLYTCFVHLHSLQTMGLLQKKRVLHTCLCILLWWRQYIFLHETKSFAVAVLNLIMFWVVGLNTSNFMNCGCL